MFLRKVFVRETEEVVVFKENKFQRRMLLFLMQNKFMRNMMLLSLKKKFLFRRKVERYRYQLEIGNHT